MWNCGSLVLSIYAQKSIQQIWNACESTVPTSHRHHYMWYEVRAEALNQSSSTQDIFDRILILCFCDPTSSYSVRPLLLWSEVWFFMQALNRNRSNESGATAMKVSFIEAIHASTKSRKHLWPAESNRNRIQELRFLLLNRNRIPELRFLFGTFF